MKKLLSTLFIFLLMILTLILFKYEDIMKKGIEFLHKKEKATLVVQVVPKDAAIRLKGGPKAFESGMEVHPGIYEMEVSKNSYETFQQKIELLPGEKKSMVISLKKKKHPPTGKLIVKTVPPDAEIRILNIRPKYQRGMSLLPGRYHLEVSKKDYLTKQPCIDVFSKKTNIYTVTLEKVRHYAPGQRWTEPTTRIEFAWVPEGCFQMGCPGPEGNCHYDEIPQHKVCVDGFWMGVYEISNASFVRFLNSGGKINAEWFNVSRRDETNSINFDGSRYFVPSQYADYPVTDVSWYGARAFAEWLSSVSSFSFQLPREAEWEYASLYGGHVDRDKIEARTVSKTDGCNCDNHLSPVGSYEPNHLGLHDMLGNVWEWCSDVYSASFYQHEKATARNPQCTYAENSMARVVRSGSFCSTYLSLRESNRNSVNPSAKHNDLGFRVIRVE